ncbi:DUF4267 domain-containing protein [Glycomyces albidus]|uniref:DUF4267 domain-containing protein n=1 Tax=Glycomyces albidus TaxID=2656774 RepID=A0A6L5G6I8_9ACTN|nr:DUF4267 domain-containing protein [Glycomyces albidus]MQM25256.1 DUF4267 domain-containing protein [Glycomyces albidus]
MELVELATALLGAGYMGIGITGVVSPEKAAGGYGVAVGDPDAKAWAGAAAWRDIVIGAVMVVAAFWVGGGAAAAILFAVALVPVGDVVTVLRRGVREPRVYLPHAAGAAITLAVAVWMLVAG